MLRFQTPHFHVVQLKNIVINYVCDCNNSHGSGAFVTFRENTAPLLNTGVGVLNEKFTFMETSPNNHFGRDS